MPYVDVNGEDLFFTAHDHDARHNLVCIHGSGEDHSTWPAGLGTLPGCNAWFLDLPGHGRSEGVPRRRVRNYADVVDGFIQTMELEQVTLAGHSLGGAIALDLALRRPDWLMALILVCTGARLKILPELRRLVRTDFPMAVERIAGNAFAPSAPRHLRDELRQRMLDNDPAVYEADFDACDHFDETDRLRQVGYKTLIISGDIDHMTPLKYSQFMEDHIPDARLTVIAPAGHYLPREQPDDLVHTIGRFMLNELA